VILSSCNIGPLRISIPGQLTAQPAIVLRRCDQARDVLCVLSFGLEPPDQMAILLLAAPGLPSELAARAAWNGETGSYPCEATNAEATLLSCKGSLIPLGGSLHIEVATADGKTIIASGDFVLNGLALPTVPGGVELPPTDAVTITPRPTRTPSAGTLYPNPTPVGNFNLNPTPTSNFHFNLNPTATPNSRPNLNPNPPSP
jgi:hypothetical protein